MGAIRDLVLTFACGVVGFFVMLGLLGLGLLCLAAGGVCALYLLSALVMTVRWWAAGDGTAGRAALGCWGIAAAAFAVTPVILRAIGLVRGAIIRRRHLTPIRTTYRRMPPTALPAWRH